MELIAIFFTGFWLWGIILLLYAVIDAICSDVKEKRQQKRRAEIEDICIELLAREFPKQTHKWQKNKRQTQH